MNNINNINNITNLLNRLVQDTEKLSNTLEILGSASFNRTGKKKLELLGTNTARIGTMSSWIHTLAENILIVANRLESTIRSTENKCEKLKNNLDNLQRTSVCKADFDEMKDKYKAKIDTITNNYNKELDNLRKNILPKIYKLRIKDLKVAIDKIIIATDYVVFDDVCQFWLDDNIIYTVPKSDVISIETEYIDRTKAVELYLNKKV